MRSVHQSRKYDQEQIHSRWEIRAKDGRVRAAHENQALAVGVLENGSWRSERNIAVCYLWNREEEKEKTVSRKAKVENDVCGCILGDTVDPLGGVYNGKLPPSLPLSLSLLSLDVCVTFLFTSSGIELDKMSVKGPEFRRLIRCGYYTMQL